MTPSRNSNQPEEIQSLLLQARAQIVKYLPRHLDSDKMIYVALETVHADAYLRQCASRRASLRQCSKPLSLA